MAATATSLAASLRGVPFNPPPNQFGRSRAGTTASVAPSYSRGPASTAASTSGPTFKAPQHKHAHHLHSIPPREKSTRTLILDHMLWMHARTRLQQARAELGMQVGREFVQEAAAESGEGGELTRDEEDQSSDGEDILNVKFSAKDHERQERSQVEEEYDISQNLPLAHNLRLRADGVEKVLIAMLDQPPEVQPLYSDDDAPRTPPTIHGSGEHHFPNGVRLRLALSTLVNDLFARDVPTPVSPRAGSMPSISAKHFQTPVSTPQVSATATTGAMPSSMSLPPPSVVPNTDLLPNGMPIVLSPLSAISSFSDRSPDLPSGAGTSLPSIDAVTRASRNRVTTDILPPIFDSAGSKPRRATGRVLSLYEHGADPSTANSPPSLRCPRHLHHSCQICAPAKPPPPSTGNSSSSSHSTGTSPKSPVVSRGAITLGANGKGIMRTIGAPPIATHVASWKSGAGIGAGLAKPGLEGTILRRRTISHNATSHPRARDAGPCSSGGKLADLIPRFIRLSALVAVELGREAKEKEYAAAKGGDPFNKNAPVPYDDESSSEMDTDDDDHVEEVLLGNSKVASGETTPARGPLASALKASTAASPFLLSMSYRPTREWYAILCGLLTRGVLEGYLSRGWKGALGMECLLGVGLGLHQQGSRTLDGNAERGTTAAADEFEHLDPDDCPSLADAAKILFPVLCKPPTSTTGGLRRDRMPDAPEAEYETEMIERISEFLTVPASTPDLSTHFEDLAYKFPAEPVERAVVRFCEAVASWRGLPELENYEKKKNPNGNSAPAPIPTVTRPAVDSLVQTDAGILHSVPVPVRMPIEKYFTAPPPPAMSPAKRRRSNTLNSSSGGKAEQHRPAKKTHFETDDWTGPYGV